MVRERTIEKLARPARRELAVAMPEMNAEYLLAREMTRER
jgi:hypothetical protein